MSRRSERYLPFVVAVLAGGAAAVADAIADVEPFSRLVSVGTMTLGVVVAGFTATQRNMLLGMAGTKVLRFAATTGYHKDVLDYLAHCIYAALFVTAVSAVGAIHRRMLLGVVVVARALGRVGSAGRRSDTPKRASDVPHLHALHGRTAFAESLEHLKLAWEPAPWPADAETIGQAIWTARSLI